jgi:hypothetical protein
MSKFVTKSLMWLTREVLLKGKAWYSKPPFLLTSLDQLHFKVNLFHKTNYHNEEVNYTEPSPIVSVPRIHTWSSQQGILRLWLIDSMVTLTSRNFQVRIIFLHFPIKV